MLELHHIKYLAKPLSPLSRSQYTVNSTNEFINMIKNKTVPSVNKMISFDVSSLFTMVPLDYTIDLTLKGIYDDKEIENKISRKDMKNLLLLCTKNVHFTFGNNIYGVTMGSSFGLVLTGIFMVHLKTCFTKINSYRKRLLKQTLDSFKTSNINYNNKINNKNNNDRNINDLFEIVLTLKLPYKVDHNTNLKKNQ